MLRRLMRSLAAFLRRDHLTRDMEDEFRLHVDLETERLVAQGVPPREARRDAERRFGSVARVRDEGRDARGIGAVEAVLRDLRVAGRSLRRTPAVTIGAMVTLALGIGATTTIVSAVSTVLLRPIPSPDLDRLVAIRETLPSLKLIDDAMAPGEVLDLAARRDLFAGVGAYSTIQANLTGQGEPVRVTAARTMGDWFGTLGVRPFRGSFYDASASADRAQVAVLSYGLWRSLGGDASGLIGGTLQLDDRAYEIVGVLPPDARYPRTAQVWLPWPQRPLDELRRSMFMNPVARLAPGVDLASLPAALAGERDAWLRRFDYGFAKDIRLRAVPFVEFDAGQLKPILVVLSGAVAFVLLIACANVASLLLVRATGRARELTVRSALGAGRWAVARQLLVESGTLALLGGAAGVGVALLAIRGIARLELIRFPALAELRLDLPVLAVAAGVSILVGILAGTAPAIRASRVNLADALKEQRRGLTTGGARHRFLHAAVVTQLALALMLLLGSGLAIRSLDRLLREDPGFRAEPVTSFALSLPYARYPDGPQRLAFEDLLRERLAGAPGVGAVGLVAFPPFSAENLGNSSPFRIIGLEPRPGDPERHALINMVDGDYFRVMGIPLLQGRLFGPEDAGSPFAAVIDETLARTWFGDRDPIGMRINQGPDLVIVGVVGSVRSVDLATPPKATVYYNYRQTPWTDFFTLTIRGTMSLEATASLVRTVVADLDPALPVFDLQPFSRRIEQSLGARRFAMGVLGTFALVALALAVIGLHGVISYGVTQRTPEIGVRMALGARPGAVTRMVIRDGVALGLAGLALGGLAFAGVSRLLGALLYQVPPHDPATLAGAALLLGLTTLAASAVPAWRAARTSPARVLQDAG